MPQLMFSWLEMQKPIIFRLGKTENFLCSVRAHFRFFCLSGFSDHGKQTSKLVTISQPNNLFLIEKHAVAIKLLTVHFDEFRQLIRQRGTKSQIMQLFKLDYNKINSILELKDVKTLKTIDDFAFALLKLDKSKEKLFEWLYEDYVQALDSENNEERNCTIASSAIILNILCNGKEDCLDIVKEEFLNDKIQELFEYNQSSKDQTEQNKLINELKTELDKSIDSLDKTDQNNNILEDIEYFREFINYGHNWVIKNLINPKFQEKIKDTRGLERLEALEYMNIDSEYTNDTGYYNKYNPIEFVCSEGQQYENLTNNEPEIPGYELIPTKETINNYINFLSQINQQNEASTSSTSQLLVHAHKINLTAAISKFTNLIAKILTEDLEEFEEENKHQKMIVDWINVGNISQKTIGDMEVEH
uniref:Uncharacterized protein n=1 Tax=Meloidogyne javanica TaxID=6303 RepID=A0A915N7U1_MELJA